MKPTAFKTITSVESLVNGSAPFATVLVERDPQTDMARVTVNGRFVAEGRSSEFVTEKSAEWLKDLAVRHGRWISPETLAETILSALSAIPEGYQLLSRRYMSAR